MNAVSDPSVKISATIHADKKTHGGFAPLIIKFIILMCGSFGSVFSFLTCIDLGVSPILVSAAIFISGAAFSLIFNLRKKLFAPASIVSMSVFLLAVYMLRNEICAGLANIANIFLARIKAEYREKAFILISEPELAERHIAIAVCFAAVLITVSAAYATIRRHSATDVCISICVPFISVLMFGLEPNPIAFTAVIVCMAAMLSVEMSDTERISGGRAKKYAAYCGLTAAVVSAVCFTAVLSAMKLWNYERPEKLNVMHENAVEYFQGGNMQQVIDDIVTIATRNTSPTGAINHGKLGEFEEISFDGKTVLQVTLPKSEDTVYLRGFVGSVYTGQSWEELSSSKLDELEEITENFSISGLTPLLFDSYSLKYSRAAMPHYSFAIKNISANNKYLYMPYNLVPESVSRYESANGNSFTGSADSYIGQFYDPKSYYGYQNLFRKRWSVSSAMSADEAAYRQFVYENYLDIPDTFEQEDIFTESYYQYITAEEVKTGKSTLDEMTVFSRKLYYIKKWLRDNCEYSLSAGKLPQGEDFVNHFLENRKGSCSHFASAAAIMCRYAGIPARYVEGYIIKPADFPAGTDTGTTVVADVSDTRGHAWVEVYIDGFGWYPIEFTSGYGNVRTALPTETTVTETEAETEISSQETERAENDTESSPVPQETEVTHTNASENSASQPSETTVPTETAESVESLSETASESENKSVGFGIFGIKGENKVDVWYDLTWILAVVIVAAAVPATLVARRNIILSLRRKRFYFDTAAGVLDDYRRFGKLIKLMKMPEQGDMSYSEYADELSKRSEMLADGTAGLVINTALKASFGGGILTKDEANEMRLAVNSLSKRYSGTLSRLEKFKLKFIYCII